VVKNSICIEKISFSIRIEFLTTRVQVIKKLNFRRENIDIFPIRILTTRVQVVSHQKTQFPSRKQKYDIFSIRIEFFDD